MLDTNNSLTIDYSFLIVLININTVKMIIDIFTKLRENIEDDHQQIKDY